MRRNADCETLSCIQPSFAHRLLRPLHGKCSRGGGTLRRLEFAQVQPVTSSLERERERELDERCFFLAKRSQDGESSRLVSGGRGGQRRATPFQA